MLDKATLRAIATTRLEDAEILLVNARYDGAVYIGGYAVELALKARICETLNWPEFPEKPHEFKNLLSFKVHNLDALLHLSGYENVINLAHFADWSIANQWNPEARYRTAGVVSFNVAQAFLTSTRALLLII